MQSSHLPETHRLLLDHYRFGECLIHDVSWHDHGATIRIVVNYIWSDFEGSQKNFGTLRSDLDVPLLVTLQFYSVQEFLLHNAWPETYDLNNLGWSHSEISGIRIVRDSDLLSPYRNHDDPYLHVQFFWEGDRRIDIVCTSMDIS